MAQQPRYQESVKWKLGAKCELFIREKMRWIKGEIIGSFTDEKGEWVKVRYGQKHVRDILSHDAELRAPQQNNMMVPMQWVDKLSELREAAYALEADRSYNITMLCEQLWTLTTKMSSTNVNTAALSEGNCD